MVLRARDVMTERVVTVRPEDTVATAVARMTEYGFGALPVVNLRHRLVGVISLIDVLRHREAGGDDSATVGAVMQQDVLTLPPRANLNVVAHRLRHYGELRMMPITDRGVLVGVVTRSDLLRSRSLHGPMRRLMHRLRRRHPIEHVPSGVPPATAAHGSTVRDIMATDFPTAHATESVAKVAKRIVDHRVQGLPVVDANRRLVGFVSEADLLGSEPLSGQPSTTVAAVMTRDVVTLAPDDSISRARLLFVEKGFRVVPVVDNDIVVGLVSRADLIRALD